jgi:hypothetical protein
MLIAYCAAHLFERRVCLQEGLIEFEIYLGWDIYAYMLIFLLSSKVMKLIESEL